MSEIHSPSNQHRPEPGYRWRGWLTSAALIALAWWGWPHVPPKVKMPFQMIRLSMQDVPTALPIPVAGVAARQLTDTWGAARGNERRHEGIDIFAARGTAVLSTTEGIVSSVGTNNLGGKVVWVVGPGGQRHYYAHLDEYADIAVGELVFPGTELGKVGNTGNARGTSPHLHYGIYSNGAINPYPFLRSVPTVQESDAK
jgi:murein DD-endopeptidase MepM/ murein hydrolase activator NlpD